MNENIDLTKILEGLEGIELHHAIYGKVSLVRTDYKGGCPVILKILEGEDSNCETGVTKKGKFVNNDYGECIVFPSKDQRDWSKFVRPIKEGIPVMCSDDKKFWVLKFYKEYKEFAHYVKNIGDNEGWRYIYIIPFDKFNPNYIEGSLKYNIQR